MKKILPLLVFLLVALMSVPNVMAQTSTGSAVTSATTSTSVSTASANNSVALPEELPQTGSSDGVIVLLISGFGLLLIGLYTRYALPIVLDENE